MLSGLYDAASTSIFFTGYAQGVLSGQNAITGTGASVLGRYFLSNNSYTLYARFGALTDGNAAVSMAFGLNGTIIVSGVIHDAGFAPYGDHDAFINFYSSNFTLLTTTYIGGAGPDGGSIITYPYILVSTYSQAVVSNNGATGTGPAIV